jgi:hypothetical protein
MESSQNIIPWTCHVCRSQFDTPHGGICARCSKATCLSHLFKIQRNRKIEAEWICDNCLNVEERDLKTKAARFDLNFPSISLRRGSRKKQHVS